ncbi:hypothetical protein Emag_000964 [Eimeria magna]
MAAPPAQSRIAAGAVAVDHGAPPSATDSAGRAGISKPYDRELFLAFMAAATRLFCDDEQIVIADFLAHEEKAYTERDLVDRLGWPDKRVREVCASLERLMLVQREQLSAPSTQGSSSAAAEGDASSSTAGSNTETSRVAGPGGAALLGSTSSSAAPYYYRVSPYAIVVVRYRIEQVDNGLLEQRRGAESRDAFTCPSCGRQYDALEAQRLRLDPDDAMFLCECGTKLEHEVVVLQDSKAVVEQLASLQRRCQEQLHLLRSLISRCWNMRVPVFPPFTRADKNEYKKQQDKSKQTACSSVGSSASGGSDTQANATSAWHHEGTGSFSLPWCSHFMNSAFRHCRFPVSLVSFAACAGVKVCVSSAAHGTSQGVIRPTPLWLRSGGGAVPLASGSGFVGLGSFGSVAPPASGSAHTVAAASNPGVPPGGTRLPVKPQESASGSSPGSSVAGGGARGQIKFSMKSSNKLQALRGTPAGRSAGAAAKTQAAATGGNGVLLSDVQGSKQASNAGGNGEAQITQAQQPTQVTSQQADAAATFTAAPTEAAVAAAHPPAAPGAGVKSTSQAPAVAEDTLRIFISRLGRDFALEEAVEYQLEMSIEEHEVGRAFARLSRSWAVSSPLFSAHNLRCPLFISCGGSCNARRNSWSCSQCTWMTFEQCSKQNQPSKEAFIAAASPPLRVKRQSFGALSGAPCRWRAHAVIACLFTPSSGPSGAFILSGIARRCRVGFQLSVSLSVHLFAPVNKAENTHHALHQVRSVKGD